MATVLWAGLFVAPSSAADTVLLSTLEWPPYSSQELPGGGASVVVARKAFAAVGLNLEVQFFPWKRAVDTGLKGDGFFGYMPEYKAERLVPICHMSNIMGDSPLGIIQRKDKPLAWKRLEDLARHTLGVVAGYVNTEEFDALMNSGRLDIRPVADDLTNIRKVQGGRIDGAVMDENVFDYLMSRDPYLRENPGNVEFNQNILELKGLYICFRKNKEGKRLHDLFNKGLATFDYKEAQDAYIRLVLGESE